MKKIFFAIVITLAAVCVSGAVFPKTPKEVVQIEYTVQDGQNLWGIVSELKKEYGDKRDPREIIYYILKENPVKHTIYPGQELNISLEVEK